MSKLLEKAKSDAIYIATNSRIPEVMSATKVSVGLLLLSDPIPGDGTRIDVQFKVFLNKNTLGEWTYVNHERNIPSIKLSAIGEITPRIDVIE